MEGKDNKMGTGNSYSESRKKGSGSGVVIFLAVLAVLLALGGAVLLRQLLSARYDAQVATIEIQKVNDEKEALLKQLDEIDAKYLQLEVEHTELEGKFTAERSRVNQLRAQLRGGDTSGVATGVAQLRQRIQELEAELESYRLQISTMEGERATLVSENAQIRTTLNQTTARNQQLETRNQELTQQVEKASVLSVSNLVITALRERRRGDEPTTSARRTNKLRVCFNVNENLVARQGNRDFYVRIINPQNQVLTSSPDNTIQFEGETIQYSIKRTINYQNKEQEVCVVWSQDGNYSKGYYNVVVFSEGREVGYKLIQLQ